MVRYLEPREIGELLDSHSVVRDQVRGRWQVFQKGEKAAFLKSHPWWQSTMFSTPWEHLNVAQWGEFLLFQPAYMDQLQVRWDGMTSTQRTQFLRWHPGMADRMRDRLEYRGPHGEEAARRPLDHPMIGQKGKAPHS